MNECYIKLERMSSLENTLARLRRRISSYHYKLVWDPFASGLKQDLSQMAKVEEVLGLVHGLASVVKDQQAASQDANSHTQANIQALSDAVQKLSIAVSSKESMTASPLRLPQLTFPEYTGREDLDRFAEQLTHVLSSSGVSPKYWFPYLKHKAYFKKFSVVGQNMTRAPLFPQQNQNK